MSYIFNSSFLRGLGIGLIISGLVFAITTAPQGATPDSQQTKQTTPKSEVESQPSKPALNETTNKTLDQTKNQPQHQTETDTTNQAQQQISPEPKTATTPPQTVATTPTAVTFIVPSGSDSTRIAELLAKAGLVKDKIKFLDVADNMKAARRFKAGTFTIPTGASEVDIILILTK